MVLDVTKLALCVITLECPSWVECSGCSWQEKLYYSVVLGQGNPLAIFLANFPFREQTVQSATLDIGYDRRDIHWARSSYTKISVSEMFAIHFQCIFNILFCTLKASWCCSGDCCIDGLQQNKLILYATNTIYMSRRIRLACWDVKQSHSLTGVTQAKLNT